MKQEESLPRLRPKAPKAAAIAGILFSVLLIVSLWLILIAVPSNPQEGGGWLLDSKNSIFLALNLMPFLGIAFLTAQVTNSLANATCLVLVMLATPAIAAEQEPPLQHSEDAVRSSNPDAIFQSGEMQPHTTLIPEANSIPLESIQFSGEGLPANFQFAPISPMLLPLPDGAFSRSASDLLPVVTPGSKSRVAQAESPFPEAPAESPSTATPNEGTENLAKQAQNPIASLISLPFQNQTNFGVGPLNRTQNVLNIQPVYPLDLGPKWNLITRTIIPLVYQPEPPTGGGGTFGLGDINPTFFFSPKSSTNVTVGFGPTFVLPTATDSVLGAGKWSIGPAAVIVWTPGKWVIGGLANNIWSFAGNSDRGAVSQLLIQPFVNYNLPKGWYLTTSPIITANWFASDGNKWLVPLGGGFGRVFKIGSQPVNDQLSAYANVVKPDNGPDWQLRAQFTMLFPR